MRSGTPSSMTARIAPVGFAATSPRSIASITRGPKTIPSSSEFDASRFAPWMPRACDLAGRPQPRQRRRAVEVGDDAAALVVGGGRDRAASRSPDRGRPGAPPRRWSGSARRSGRGRWRRARDGRRPVRASEPSSRARPHRGAAARRRSARPWHRAATRRGPAAPRRAAAAARPGGASAVGWNCTNSMSATATPERSAIARPSPVDSSGLVVTANT